MTDTPTIDAVMRDLFTSDVFEAYTGLDGITAQFVPDYKGGHDVLVRRDRLDGGLEYATAPILRPSSSAAPGETWRAIEYALKLAATTLVRFRDLARGPYG